MGVADYFFTVILYLLCGIFTLLLTKQKRVNYKVVLLILFWPGLWLFGLGYEAVQWFKRKKAIYDMKRRQYNEELHKGSHYGND